MIFVTRTARYDTQQSCFITHDPEIHLEVVPVIQDYLLKDLVMERIRHSCKEISCIKQSEW